MCSQRNGAACQEINKLLRELIKLLFITDVTDDMCTPGLKKTTATESCCTSEMRKGEAHHSDASACRRPCTRGLMSRMMSRGLITVSAYCSSYVRCVRGAGSR